MIIKVNYTVSDIYMSTSVSAVYIKVVYSGVSGGSGTVTSVGLTMPSAFSVANSPVTSSGTLAVTAAGSASQYIRGDGELATLPSTSSGGSSVNYYLNGSVSASVAGYNQLSNSAIIGTGTDFTLSGNGLIAQFLTDVGNPNRLEIPGGAWNFEMYFQSSSTGGNTKFYVELLKYDGTTFTSIASSSAIPEQITGGTAIDLYLTSLAVPTTSLLVTDRLAIRVYIVDNSGGRTITLHTEDNTLCEIITTFAGGISALNGLTANTQYFATGTSGTSFNIVSVGDTHTFNLPPSANIYTADGTLTGNRTISMSNYSLFFTGETGTINGKTLGTNSLTDYAGINMYNSLNELVGSVQIGGVNAGTTSLRGHLFLGARQTGGNVYIIDTTETPVHGFYSSGNVGINTGTSMSPSAQLEVRSITSGFLPPRMTTSQKNAISSPATGLQVYDTTLGSLNVYNGTSWIALGAGGGGSMAIGGAITSATAGSVLFAGTSGVLQQDNANLFWDDTNNRLGIGTATPSVALELGTSTLGAEQLINPTIGSTNIAPTITAGNYTTTGYTISGGIYSKTSGSAWQGGSTNAVIVYGNSYQVSITFNTWTSGTGVNVYLGGIFLFRVTTTGTYTKKITAVNTDQLIFDGNTSLYSINSIIINNISLGNITLGGKLKLLGNISSQDGTSAISILPNGGAHVLNNLLIATNWSTTQNDQGSKYPSRVAKLEIVGDDSFTGNYIRLITKASSQFCYTNFVHEISNFKIQQYINGTSYPNAFVIDNGRLLVNTATSGGYQLDVNGTARVSGDMVVNGMTIGKGLGNVSTNTVIGFDSMLANTTGAYSTCIGYQAGKSNTTSRLNVAIGYQALYSNSSGSDYNVAIGVEALFNSNSTGNNTAIGRRAMYSNTLGLGNVVLGDLSLNLPTNSNYNTIVGSGCASGTTGSTGERNTIIGNAAFVAFTSAQRCIAIGQYSLFSITTGSFNVAIGNLSGAYYGATGTNANTTSENSIYLGYQTRASSNGNSNEIVIGHQTTGAGSNSVTLGNTSITKTILRGTINAANLPTSATGLSAGDIWNDAGTLKIV